MFRKFMFSAIASLLFFCSFSAVCNATRHVEQITLDDAYEILATVVEETGMMAEPVVQVHTAAVPAVVESEYRFR